MKKNDQTDLPGGLCLSGSFIRPLVGLFLSCLSATSFAQAPVGEARQGGLYSNQPSKQDPFIVPQDPAGLTNEARKSEKEKSEKQISKELQARLERHRPIVVAPVDLKILTGKIDNDLLRQRFTDAGRSLIQSPIALKSSQIVELLEQRKNPVQLPIPNTALKPKIRYEDIARASLMFGSIYDCGRCNNIHENVAGGVVISHDGLAVTNYHVLDQDYEGTLANLAMTFDGTPRPILDVLYANKLADVALVRLGGDAPFYPIPIATVSPMPLEEVTVLSNPKHNFFVLTTGVINRHVRYRGKTGASETWTEITAEYAAGSSGSGVFDSRGALVALVSANAPLERVISHRELNNRRGRGKSEDNETYYEMTLRRCVTLEAIRGCFAQGNELQK